VFALSSTTEGFSIACIEAMACGVPVVATRSGGPEQIIEDGVSGLLVPVSDAAALATAIAHVANTPVLSRRLIDAGMLRVRERYALQVMTTTYGRVLQTLTGRLS
jgi:glycosyltransferase involved in cell wall biosynthesis